jgi:hypothetical protein
MANPDDDRLERLAERVVQAVHASGCRGSPWVVYDAVRVYVESDAGVLGYLTVHGSGEISAEGMQARGDELLAHVRRVLGGDAGTT